MHRNPLGMVSEGAVSNSHNVAHLATGERLIFDYHFVGVIGSNSNLTNIQRAEQEPTPDRSNRAVHVPSTQGVVLQL